MSRYIDADFILDGIKNDRALIKDGKMDNYKEHYLAFLEKCVELTPSNDIVRCKDCKWAEPNREGDYDCRCHIPIFRVSADDFCSMGERREP